MEAAGIIDDMPIADYHADHAVSKSGLKVIREWTPEHYHYQFRNPLAKKPKASKEKIFGNALHTLVLEPIRFFLEYVEGPAINKNSKAYREFVALAEKQGQIVLGPEDMDRAHAMAHKLEIDPDAMEFMPGKNPDAVVERSFFWTDPETGIRCKCRPDIMYGDIVVPDLKTTKDARMESFRWDILNYGYHMQDASNTTGINLLMPDEVKDFLFICIENDPPHCVAVRRMTPEYKRLGYIHYREAIDRVAQCEKTGLWPGYGPGIREIDPPRSVARDYDLETNDNDEDIHGYEENSVPA